MISKTIEIHNNQLISSNSDENQLWNMPVAFAKVALSGFLIDCNESFMRLFGLNSKEQIFSINYLNNNYRSIESNQKLSAQIKINKEFSINSVWKSFTNNSLNVKEYFKLVEKNQDKECFYYVLIEDNTEKERFIRSLEITEEKYKFLIDQIPVGIYRIITTGEIVFCNNYLANLLGYKNSDELIGTNAEEVFHYPIEYYKKRIEEINKKSTSFIFEFSITNKEGKKLWLHDAAKIFYDTSDEVLIYDGIIQDISSRKEAEINLLRLITAFNQISEGIVVTDLQGRVIYLNPALEKMTGRQSDELSGQKLNIISSGQHSRDFYRKLWNTISNGKKWEGTIINKRKNGKLYNEYMVITPVKDADGEITNYVAVKRDITDIIKLEEQLRNSQKLQAIGTFAGGIAHDFNNILMGMQIFTEVLKKKISPDSEEYQLLEKVFESQNRAKELIKQILLFSRQSSDERQPLAIHILVKEVIKVIRSIFPPTIEIHQDIEECGYILGNPAHVHQILMNLCSNAQYAMNDKGALTIQLKRVDYIERSNGNIDHTGNDWIRLIVKDTGCGIDDKIKHRIFEPFFTTKKVGEGTGLGLATVHSIVKQYNGEIFFKSNIGEGTEFIIFLPAL